MGKRHVIYTDGGCYQGVGAWAFVEIDPVLEGVQVPSKNARQHVINHGEAHVEDTTNNRMELIAIMNAIKSCEPGDTVVIYSDSGYCVTGYTNPSYLQKWIENGWRTSNKKPVMNDDLWKEMVIIGTQYDLEFHLIRGHGKTKGSPHNVWNNMCDETCTKYRTLEGI